MKITPSALIDSITGKFCGRNIIQHAASGTLYLRKFRFEEKFPSDAWSTIKENWAVSSISYQQLPQVYTSMWEQYAEERELPRYQARQLFMSTVANLLTQYEVGDPRKLCMPLQRFDEPEG